MHEDEGVAALLVVVLDRVQMHVGDAAAGLGEGGEFEIMRGEQGVSAIGRGQMFRAGFGQREAVVRRCAASDFVHQHQRLRGGVMQDVAGFAHFDHEGRLPAGEVVARADAGEDAVDRADQCFRRGHEAADVRQQHDQRVLAHVGALAAHVRTGDDQHAPRRATVVAVERQVVRLERLVAHRFHDRMPAAFDVQACVFDQLRLRPVEFARALGETGEHIEFAQCTSGALERFEIAIEFVEDAFIQQLFARERAVFRRQHLVFELFQLFGDVALGPGQCLPARVVDGCLVDLALGDLDVIAVDAVVADLQRGDAAARAFTGFQIDQELVGMRAEGAQFVQFGVVAFGDHPAVAGQHRWLLHDRAGHPRRLCIVFAQFGAQRLQSRRIDARQRIAHFRQQAQGVAQGRQVAGARAAQGNP